MEMWYQNFENLFHIWQMSRQTSIQLVPLQWWWRRHRCFCLEWSSYFSWGEHYQPRGFSYQSTCAREECFAAGFVVGSVPTQSTGGKFVENEFPVTCECKWGVRRGRMFNHHPMSDGTGKDVCNGGPRIFSPVPMG